jgi:site-specific recombinase XerD
MDQYLKSRTDHSDALIVSFEHKDRMTATNVQLLVRNSAKRAGITKKVTPHTLRHSFATNFLRNNGNMRYLSAMLGHASMDTTMMYAHVVDHDLQAQYEKYHSI